MLSVGMLTMGTASPRARRGSIASVAHANDCGKSFVVEPNARLERLQDTQATQPGRMASA